MQVLPELLFLISLFASVRVIAIDFVVIIGMRDTDDGTVYGQGAFTIGCQHGWPILSHSGLSTGGQAGAYIRWE